MKRSEERKVKVALYGRDLRATVKNYPINSDGTRIEIASGGDAHFMPEIDKETYIELPYRSILPPFKTKYQRLYVAQKWCKKCVNFVTGEVLGPDPEQVMRAARNKILESKGKQKTETPIIFWLMLAVNIIILLKVMGVFS